MPNCGVILKLIIRASGSALASLVICPPIFTLALLHTLIQVIIHIEGNSIIFWAGGFTTHCLIIFVVTIRAFISTNQVGSIRGIFIWFCWGTICHTTAIYKIVVVCFGLVPQGNRGRTLLYALSSRIISKSQLRIWSSCLLWTLAHTIMRNWIPIILPCWWPTWAWLYTMIDSRMLKIILGNITFALSWGSRGRINNSMLIRTSKALIIIRAITRSTDCEIT